MSSCFKLVPTVENDSILLKRNFAACLCWWN